MRGIKEYDFRATVENLFLHKTFFLIDLSYNALLLFPKITVFSMNYTNIFFR